MVLAAAVLLALTIFMIISSPLRMASPSALLAGAWAFVYTLQSIFAADMKNSLLATIAIFTITLSFSAGELIGCGGLGIEKQFRVKRAAPSTMVSGECCEAKELKKLIIVFSLIVLVGVVEYAFFMGLLEARNFADLILSPGAARLEVSLGERVIPMYSRFGILLAYSGAVLSMAYYYLYRWRWWLALPMIEVLLFAITQSGRAGAMMVVVQVALSMYLKNVIVPRKSLARILLRSAILPGAAILIFFVGGQFLREGFKSTEAEDIMRVMYSARGYLFGGLSAFSYWINNIHDPGSLSLGKYTFSSLFSSLKIIPQDSGIYQYYAPISSTGEVSNVYTAYRSFIEDFSFPGACLIYFVAGVFIASITRGLVNGKRILILVVIPMLSWLALSPMFSATYFNSFLLSCFLPYLLVRKIWRAKSADDQIPVR
jgi:oligosaccharide repeat unit polymerase